MKIAFGSFVRPAILSCSSFFSGCLRWFLFGKAAFERAIQSTMRAATLLLAQAHGVAAEPQLQYTMVAALAVHSHGAGGKKCISL